MENTKVLSDKVQNKIQGKAHSDGGFYIIISLLLLAIFAILTAASLLFSLVLYYLNLETPVIVVGSVIFFLITSWIIFAMTGITNDPGFWEFAREMLHKDVYEDEEGEEDDLITLLDDLEDSNPDAYKAIFQKASAMGDVELDANARKLIDEVLAEFDLQ